MAIRLSEVHPSLVHFPIALLPTALAADAVGSATRNRELFAIGRWGIVLAAASAAVAGTFGFIAQEEVNLEGHALDILRTHRTLNIGALVAVSALAVARFTRKKPSLAYLIAGAALTGLVGFSGYLGGKLVYKHGVGVKKAGGIYGSDPKLTARTAPKKAISDLGKALKSTAKDIAEGEIAPTLRGE
jgi:uncharacterized membrane protein